MRKIALAVLLLTIGVNAMAQTEKGRWLLGAQIGNFAYRKLEYVQGHSLNLDLRPTAGYFLANNLLVALGIPYQIGKTNSVFKDSLYRQIGVSPSIRYYIGKTKVKPFIGFSYSYQWGKSRQSEDSPTAAVYTSKFFTHTLSPSLGVAYFIQRNVALTIGLSYNRSTGKEYWMSTVLPNPDNDFFPYLRKNVTLDVGFSVLLGK